MNLNLLFTCWIEWAAIGFRGIKTTRTGCFWPGIRTGRNYSTQILQTKLDTIRWWNKGWPYHEFDLRFQYKWLKRPRGTIEPPIKRFQSTVSWGIEWDDNHCHHNLWCQKLFLCRNIGRSRVMLSLHGKYPLLFDLDIPWNGYS